MSIAQDLFDKPGTLVGMVHLDALPGTPFAKHELAAIVEQAAADAELLARAGFEVLLVENMGDRPYLNQRVGPEIVSAMTAACLEVRRAVPQLPLGVQVLAGANEAALAVAQASGAQFIRAEGFLFASIADEGLMPEAAAGPLLRYRKQIGADHIAVLCDLKKKHSSHAITSDLSIAETAKAAVFCGADGVIVTGSATGEAASAEDLRAVATAIDLPVLIGSGVTPDNASDYMQHAKGFIVGSYLKQEGAWQNRLNASRCEAFSQSVLSAR